MTTVRIKRVYDERSVDDGYRILVDRIWPRGVSKEHASVDIWMRSVAPTDSLRKWFGHEASKWEEFKKRYTKEIEHSPDFDKLLSIVKEKKKVTLVYSAKDPERNQAVVLKELLEKRV